MMKTTTGIGEWIALSYEAKVPFLQQVPRECADFLLLNAQLREYEPGEIILEGAKLPEEGEKITIQIVDEGKHKASYTITIPGM